MPLIKSSHVALQWTNSCDSAVDAACLKCVAPTAIYAHIFMISKWLETIASRRIIFFWLLTSSSNTASLLLLPKNASVKHEKYESCHIVTASSNNQVQLFESSEKNYYMEQIAKYVDDSHICKNVKLKLLIEVVTVMEGKGHCPSWRRWQAALGLFVIEPMEFKLFSNCRHVCCCITPLLPSLGNMLVCLVKQLLTLSCCSL